MKAASEVRPAVGMSVSMHIGSDSYHEIVVKTERNAKTIYTMSASSVMEGLSVGVWNSLPQSVKEQRIADKLEKALAHINRELYYPTEDVAMARVTSCYTFRSTGARAGRYVEKGSDYCILTLNSDYSYQDPSF